MPEYYDRMEDMASADPEMDGALAEFERAAEEAQAERMRIIEAVGKEVAKKRDAAVSGRAQSGIEKIWAEDEEYYLGIDDSNRDTSSWIKPAGYTGGLTKSKPVDSARCTAFFNVTAQFCDSAAARMGDILLPANDWNFVVDPTPVPEWAVPQQQQEQIPPQEPPPQPMPEQAVAPGIPPGMAPMPMPVPQAPPSHDEIVERAETRIKDWLTECNYHGEVRMVIEDAVRIGTGVLKGPFPTVVKRSQVQHGQGMVAVIQEQSINPASMRISPWDFFPDPECGDSIHNGAFAFERTMMTARQLRELKEDETYIAEQIDAVLEEGPGSRHYSDGVRTSDLKTSDDDRFEVWFGYCHLDADKLEQIGVDGYEEEGEGPDSIPVVVTLVNDRVIKCFLNPLDDGDFPYDVMPWQPMPGSPWGIGVARKGRVPQEMLNASARALMDNAGLSASPMIIVRRNAIYPADGDWTLRARKVFIATEQGDTRSVADAIMAINIPTMQAELQAIIQMAYKMMEDATSIAFLMQGQQGSAPDTVGGMELLNRNASAVLRRMARTFDERITEPHIRRYYSWLLTYGEDAEKGDVQIRAIGSSSLVEREIQAIETYQLLAASANPAYGLDPEKTMAEVLKLKRIAPEKLQLDPEKKQQMAQQPQVIPAVEVAKINAQSRLEAAQINAEVTKHKVTVDTDRDTAYNDSLARRDEQRAQLELEALRVKERLAILDYANKREMLIEEVKAKLAEKTMALRVQKELAAVDARGPEVATPPTEPPGRAAPGAAFQA